MTADYDAQSAVERELVLRLASLLWRLRRATAIESGLFKIQAQHLLQFRQRRQAHQKRQNIIESMYRDAAATEDDMRQSEDEPTGSRDPGSQSTAEFGDQSDDLTRSFIRLTNLPTYPLDRLSRYEATLWRQACQILFALRCLSQSKPWARTNVALKPAKLRTAAAWRLTSVKQIAGKETLQNEITATLRAVTKLGGGVELMAPGSLPNDGKVIADERKLA